MNVRVRFAPSPTGFLHIGGARTALFNWLYARHTGGVFVLRIEDTDLARNTQEAVEVILDGLRWLGLDWDEGPTSGQAAAPSQGARGPYFQSQRSDLYRQRVRELIDKGVAYENEGTVKFKMSREPMVISDLIVGKVTRELTDREALDPDFVIVRSDGQPVFHLVNVVDDIAMGITHVIRGEDHLANTAKHLALFRAFEAEPPHYAHIPLILNPNGSKMSKRDQGASLVSYMEEGYAPEAVLNYLVLLGWSPKGNREIMPLNELIALFDLPQILRHNARFDHTKLNWMNGAYIRAMEMERYVGMGRRALERAGINLQNFDPTYVQAALETCKEKIEVFSALPGFADFYFLDQPVLPDMPMPNDFSGENHPRLVKLRDALSSLAVFNAETIGATLKAVATELGVKTGVLVHPTRLACTGKTIGPSLYHLLAVLGKVRVLQRLDLALARTR